MTSTYNRLIYDNYCLQTRCSQLSMQNSIIESRIQTLESRIQTLESNIYFSSNNSPNYSRKSRNKPPTFSMNHFTPIILPRRQSKKPPIYNKELEQYSSLTEDSDA